jgi:hypothetical protein
MFGKFSRVIAVAMAAVLCFVLLLPMALKEHNSGMAFVVVAVFVAYIGANAYLWMKLRGKT